MDVASHACKAFLIGLHSSMLYVVNLTAQLGLRVLMIKGPAWNWEDLHRRCNLLICLSLLLISTTINRISLHRPNLIPENYKCYSNNLASMKTMLDDEKSHAPPQPNLWLSSGLLSGVDFLFHTLVLRGRAWSRLTES